MTNKTDDMPQEYPYKVWVYNRDGKLEVRDCSIVVGNIEYTRSVEITDERVKEAHDRLEYRTGKDSKDEQWEEDYKTVGQALSDYGQMVELILKFVDLNNRPSLNYDLQDLIEEYGPLIKKCRGKDNG